MQLKFTYFPKRYLYGCFEKLISQRARSRSDTEIADAGEALSAASAAGAGITQISG